MKNRMIILVVGALMACLLPQAVWAQQEWQSTSTMQGSGSAYSSQVTTVGAANVGNMATTTYSQSPSMASGRRRINDGGTNNDGGHTEDENSPLGDAVLPLLLMAAGFGLYTALRRRKETA